MKSRQIPFSTLRRYLEGLGFVTHVGAGGFIMCEHAESGCKLYYPAFRDNDIVPALHIGITGKFLDEFGLVERDDFEDQLRQHSIAG